MNERISLALGIPKNTDERLTGLNIVECYDDKMKELSKWYDKVYGGVVLEGELNLNAEHLFEMYRFLLTAASLQYKVVPFCRDISTIRTMDNWQRSRYIEADVAAFYIDTQNRTVMRWYQEMLKKRGKRATISITDKRTVLRAEYYKLLQNPDELYAINKVAVNNLYMTDAQKQFLLNLGNTDKVNSFNIILEDDALKKFNRIRNSLATKYTTCYDNLFLGELIYMTRGFYR